MVDAEVRTRTLASLVDGLLRPFDLLGYLHALTMRCATVLGSEEAGIVLTTPHQALRVVAASSERQSILDLLQLQDDGGPCRDCWQTSEVVEELDLLGAGPIRWPAFAQAAAQFGFVSTAAFPLRMHSKCVGALNIFARSAKPLDLRDRAIGQAIADLAAVAVLQERFHREQSLLDEQLQAALNNRVLLEQAKGVVAELQGIDTDAASELIANRATITGVAIGDFASDIVTRRVSLDLPPA